MAEALATHLPEHMTVATPKTRTGRASIEDWMAYDRRFAFPVHRSGAFEVELPRGLPGAVRGPLQFAWNVLWTRRRVGRSLVDYLRKHPVDVVCINTLSSYWVAGMLKRAYPTLKVVFYLHGEEVAGGPGVRKIDRYKHRALQAADAVVVVSRFTRGRALACGVAAQKIHVIHNGVDVERFTPGPRDAAIEARFGLAGKRLLLCLARLDERKGQDMLLRAMPSIRQTVPEAVLLLVGGGTDEARLKGLAGELGLGASAVFAGVAADDEVVAFYRTADVFAMPNRELANGDTEGFGLVFLEAGACGRPVVGGRAGGVPDAVLDGETGLLVDGRSVEEIAAACIRLLGDPTLARSMGERGLAHSAENTWPRQAARFLGLCSGLCAPRAESR